MDIMLPVMDGLEATKRIVAERPVPVLILTARDAEAGQGHRPWRGAPTIT